MEINRFIDIYNKWISERYNTKTHFVLKKEVIQSTVTKSLKTFKWTLYFVNGSTIKEVRGVSHTITGVTEQKEKEIKENLEELVTRWIIELPYDTFFKEMMEGRYEGQELPET